MIDSLLEIELWLLCLTFIIEFNDDLIMIELKQFWNMTNQITICLNVLVTHPHHVIKSCCQSWEVQFSETKENMNNNKIQTLVKAQSEVQFSKTNKNMSNNKIQLIKAQGEVQLHEVQLQNEKFVW